MTASHSSSVMLTSMRSRRMPAFSTTASSLPKAETAWSIMCLAPFQSETSSPLATASPPLALISFTTCWAGPTSWPLPARSPPRSFTTTLAPCSASIRQCSRPTPRAPPVTIATRPSHNLAIAPSRLLRVWNGPCCASLATTFMVSHWEDRHGYPAARQPRPGRPFRSAARAHLRLDEGLGRQRQAAGPSRRHHAQGRARLRRDLRQGRRRAQQAGATRHDLPHLLDDQTADLDGDHDAV